MKLLFVSSLFLFLALESIWSGCQSDLNMARLLNGNCHTERYVGLVASVHLVGCVSEVAEHPPPNPTSEKASFCRPCYSRPAPIDLEIYPIHSHLAEWRHPPFRSIINFSPFPGLDYQPRVRMHRRFLC